MPAHGFSCAGIQVHVNLDACTTSIKTAEYLLIRVVIYFYKNKNDDLMYYYQLLWFQIVLMLFHNNYAHFAAFLVSGCLHKRSLCRHPETKDVESISNSNVFAHNPVLEKLRQKSIAHERR